MGIVSTDGVYLAGSGYWYPELGPDLVEYEMTVALPDGWQVISSGNGTSRDASGTARWDSHGPIDEITVVGGPLSVYRDTAGAVETLVYLREKDDALATKYLQATAQYLEMYRSLIGPYPYGKFALVENFWETGYGMPSYTLLGSQVIRLPFIITSSYPHEILHNWWGNSVFVDYASGNWCEGLTAYMADFLIQEQRGRGADYRRDTLQKYRNYVRDGRDFPLTEFRSRHSAATEAVGYGKTLMFFHMLRLKLGDEGFRRWAATFYRAYRGRQASFADVRTSMEVIAKADLGRFFADHVTRPGAASLAVSATAAAAAGGGWTVTGTLSEAQPGAPLELDVPLVVQTAGAPVAASVHIDGAAAAFTVACAARPLALHVDPWFDVFRLLDPREIPPSLGQAFGEPKPLAVLPAKATAAEQAAYRALVEAWRSDSQQPEITTDAEVRTLPADRAVYVLGRGNLLAAALDAGNGWSLEGGALTIDRESMPLAGNSAVIVRRNPGNVDKAVAWIFADDLAALPALGRKLPHYGKYSYLGFTGADATNVLKGQWGSGDSPLRVDLRPAGERTGSLPPLAAPERKALAELPPVFSRNALMSHVEWLAAPEREGRGIGSRGLEAAGEYVAAAFKAIGLKPGGDGGTYFQSFTTTATRDGAPATLRNVVGVLPGSKAEWAGQSALLTAHYDHLGFGWPDPHQGDEGKLHPGADDNASGVAVLLELARALAAEPAPQRTMVFVAFSGEEEGLLGSRYYVEHPLYPLEKIEGVINLDTVGRLFDKKLSVMATGTAREWPFIFQGAGFTTGVEGRMIPEGYASSDQKSFIDKGVPAVQLFTDPHADYHRPGDTADKIDAAGLVKVATYVKEAFAYLGERAEPLAVTIAAAGAAPPPAAGQGRRVSFGTMPDFAFPGPGVKVAGVTPGSPAAKAGIREGDILLRIDGRDLADLAGFSGVLKQLHPGQTVKALVERGGEKLTVDVTVVER
jgi:aminopeptidase N